MTFLRHTEHRSESNLSLNLLKTSSVNDFGIAHRTNGRHVCNRAKRYFTGVSLLLLLAACDGGSGDSRVDAVAPIVTNLTVTDNANGSIGVSFKSSGDQSQVLEYRVLAIPVDDVTPINVDFASGLGSGSYQAVNTGSDIESVSLSTNSRDINGNPLLLDSSYLVSVLTVADGSNANINAISIGTGVGSVVQSSVKITYVGNDGVLITDGDKTVIIDGIQKGVGWVDLAPSETTRLEQASPPYDRIDVAMISHAHTDHYSAASISSHLNNNSTIRVLAPPQVRSGFVGQPRLENVSPAFQTKEDVTINGVDITVYHLRHFNQFGNDFSTVENYGYLVRIGGLNILHLGDVDYAADNFDKFDFPNEGIDVVLLPTFNTLLSEINRDIIVNLIAPKQVIGLHLQANRINSEAQQVRNLYTGGDVFTQPLEYRRY